MHRDVRGQHAPDGGIVPRGLLRRSADLREGLHTAVGHEGQQKCDGDAQRLKQVIQYRSQARALALVLGENPGRRLVNILVGALHNLKNSDQCSGYIQSIHGGIHLAGQGGSQAFQLIVQGIGLAVGAHSTAKVLFAHSDRTGQQVAQVVGQVGIDAVDQGFIGESTIVAERNFA